MAVANLTKRVVDATKQAGVDVFVWDVELPMFGLKVTPKGKKSFIYQYRQHGTLRRATIGRYGPFTVDEARIEAKQLAAAVAKGEDPQRTKSDKLRSDRERTVAGLAPGYIDELAAKRRPRTAYEARRVIEKHILPALGKRPIASLTLADVKALHLAHRAAPIMANRIVTTLRALWRWSDPPPGAQNPFRGFARWRFPEQERERFLSRAEVWALAAALDRAEAEGLPVPPDLAHQSHGLSAKQKAKRGGRPKRGAYRLTKKRPLVPADPFAVAVIRFLMLSGWREQEALTLKWSDVDTETGRVTLPHTKTGRSHRMLGIRALEALPVFRNGPFVFPGRDPEKPLREIKRVWLAGRHAAGLKDVRLHDIRHSFASFAVGAGVPLFTVAKLLGHKRRSITERYSHLADDTLKAAADAVSEAIWQAMNGVTPEAKVLPFIAQAGAA